MADGKIIALTGGTGYVGSNLARSIAARGHRLRALVRNPAAAEELRRLGAEIVVGDLREPETIRGFAEGADTFFHIAALFRQAGFPDKVYWDVNLEGTRLCLEEAKRAGVRRFVHCSTIGVLSHIENPPADETLPYHPGDVYQESKAAGEQLALEWFRDGRIPGVVIRPAMIYGPGDERLGKKLFLPVARRRFIVLGSGRILHHYVYIDDLVEAFWLAADREGVNGEIFIIAGPDPVTISDLVETIAREAGVSPPRLKLPVEPFQWLGSLCEAIFIPLHLEPPIYRRRVDFFTKTRSFSIEKARRMLGYEPKVGMEEGIRRTLAWYRQHGVI